MPESQPFDFTAMFTNSANLSTAQKEWAETVERISRDWVALFEADAKLGSDFVTKLSGAKAPSDVAAAFQEWITARTELASKEWQRLVNSCARIAGNGRFRSS